MTEKIQIGKTCRVWDNNSAAFPREVQDELNLTPGSQFRYVKISGHIEIERVV